MLTKIFGTLLKKWIGAGGSFRVSILLAQLVMMLIVSAGDSIGIPLPDGIKESLQEWLGQVIGWVLAAVIVSDGIRPVAPRNGNGGLVPPKDW